MKKIFFFLCFFVPVFTSAASIKDLEVENGVLSREFETTNNTYSILLNDGEERVRFSYDLFDSDASVTIKGDTFIDGMENKTVMEVENTDGTTEIYTFYLEKESVTPVFQEFPTINETKKVIPYLSYYVGIVCFLIILILFKIIVLGFKKRK